MQKVRVKASGAGGLEILHACGFAWTSGWQEADVDAATLERLQANQYLTVEVLEDVPQAQTGGAGDPGAAGDVGAAAPDAATATADAPGANAAQVTGDTADDQVAAAAPATAAAKAEAPAAKTAGKKGK